MWTKICRFLNHERYQVVVAVLCAVIVFSGLCCQSKTRSVLDPNRQVTRLELISEIQTFNAQVEVRMLDLDRKDQVRKQLLDFFSLWTSSGQLNPGGIIPLLVSMLGIGAITDNVRKRKELTDLKNAG